MSRTEVAEARAEIAEIRATQATQYTEFMARFDVLQQILERDVASLFVLRPRTPQPPSASPAPPSPIPAPVDPPYVSPPPAVAEEPTEHDTDI